MSSTLNLPPHLNFCFSSPTSLSFCPSTPIHFSSTPFPLRTPKPHSTLPSIVTSSIFFLQNPPLTAAAAAAATTKITSSSNDCNSEDKDTNKPRSSEPHKYGNHSAAIKMPTAPWMQGPLLLPPTEVLDLSKPQIKKKKKTGNGGARNSDRVLTEKISGGRGRKAMKKILHSIEKLEGTDDSDCDHQNLDGFGGGISFEGVGDLKVKSKMPWVKEERVVIRRPRKEKVLTAGEMSLDPEMLKRLRGDAAKMRKWVKVKKLGVTQAVVDEVHSIWRNNELVMLKFDIPLCRNMDRAREIVELKSGGLVVWSKKDSLVAFRGCNYKPTKCFGKIYPKYSAIKQASALTTDHPSLEINSTYCGKHTNGGSMLRRGKEEDLLSSESLLVGDESLMPSNGSLYERETDRLLDGLGPRFVDWWYPKPLPVDADLLPEVVPGFKPPLRIPQPGLRAKLTDEELTYLRKLAHPLPTHFVLGRNAKLQGLAAAILKLWQKSIIAKISVKWGVPNTNNELMATELKNLTGGVLLLRNKFIIILYRGKDFLPREVAHQVLEREGELEHCYLHEEDARLKGYETSNLNDEVSADAGTAGTLSEFNLILAKCGDLNDRYKKEEVQLQAEKERLEKELRSQEHKLAILKMKIERSAKGLFKLDSAWNMSSEEPDQELITDEERECFRKIALKMDRVLVLGRRGIFDGVIEGLHQHWKHRELVKVITMQRTLAQVIYTAKMLERESGGILVSVDKMKEGHAIIIYRGRNYTRPLDFGGNLLNKRKALQRSLEMQRFGSLKFFASQRERAISDLKEKLAELPLKSKETDLKEKSEELSRQEKGSRCGHTMRCF
ncbi:hypothetical protein Dimus_023179 [Dionaea muscipula]